jgi:hypothetical protein
MPLRAQMFSFLLGAGLKSFYRTMLEYGVYTVNNLTTICHGYNGHGITGQAVQDEPFDYGCQNRWEGMYSPMVPYAQWTS